jgi:hypothetical protein
MGQLDVRRCRHCEHPVATVQVADGDGSRPGSVVVLCDRCDRLPRPEDAMFVPQWDDA